MNFYQVAPLIQTSINQKGVFTYEHKENISFGSLIWVDFNNKKVKAILLKKVKKPFFKTKKIEKIIKKSILNKQQIKLAKKISTFYYCSFGSALKLFIPKITQKIKRGAKESIKIKKGPDLTIPQKKATDKIIESKNLQYLLTGPSSSGKTEIIMKFIEKKLENKEQALILIPDIFLSYQEIDRYKKRFGSNKVALLHSELKASDYFRIWNKIKKGNIKIVISTKIGLFCNFHNLRLIAIDEEQDISHKNWEQTPRYHAKKISQMLSEIYQAKLIFMSATPSMESLNENKKNIITLPSLKTRRIEIKKPEIISIDLKKYYKNFKKNLVLSNEFIKNLEKIIQSNKLALILSPQRGKGRYVICKNCKKIIKCPQCKVSLINSGDSYKCLHCNYKISNLSPCPYCRSIQLESIGFGTEKLYSEIQKKFPKSKIAKIDGNDFRKNDFRKKLYQDIKNNKINILIGTQTIIKGFDLKQIEMVAILNKESFNENLDFRNNERNLGNLFQLGGRLNRPENKNKGIFIIQTFEPEDPLMNYLKHWNWKIFAEEELKQRKILEYPPYTKLIKLIYKNKNRKIVEKNTKKIYNQLLNNNNNNNQNLIKVFPPYEGLIKKKRFFWEKNILLKVKKIEDKSLEKIFLKLKDGWLIDINPNNIF